MNISAKSKLTADNLRELIDTSSEALFVVTPSGHVEFANSAGVGLLASDPTGQDLSEKLDKQSHDRFRRFLRRCTASSSATIGAFQFVDAEGAAQKLRVSGRRMTSLSVGDEVRLALSMQTTQGANFSVLSKTVARLNEQNRMRLTGQMDLEAALARQKVLISELFHRVKNNLQLQISLSSRAARTAESQELVEYLTLSKSRLMAMSLAHDAVYQDDAVLVSSVKELLMDLSEYVTKELSPQAGLTMKIEDHQLANDRILPLALVLIELLSNACTHGLRDGRGAIVVGFRRSQDSFELSVADDGSGFSAAETGTIGSGLKLAEAFARQLKGTLSLANGDGAHLTVRFPCDA